MKIGINFVAIRETLYAGYKGWLYKSAVPGIIMLPACVSKVIY